MSQKSKSKSGSGKMSTKDAFRTLKLSPSASIDEINSAFKTKLNDIQTKYADRPDKMVMEADRLYAAYRTAYMSKNGPEDQLLPLTLQGSDSILNAFGIQVPHESMSVQMESQAQYKDGQLVKNATSKTETVIHEDGKRETKVYENGKLVRHTIDGKDILK